MTIFPIVFEGFKTLLAVDAINYMFGFLAFALVVYGLIIIFRGRG